MHQLINNKNFRLFVYFLFLLFLSTLNNYKLNKSYEDLFKIKSINIYGLENNQKKLILDKLRTFTDKNIFSLDKDKIIEIVETFNFLDEYSVSKKYPSELNLYFRHTKLIASTLKDNKMFYIGKNGKLIVSKNYSLMYSLPNVFGNFKVDEFLIFLNLLKDNGFAVENISDFYFFPSKRWDIKFNNNLVIKFPRTDIEKSIKIAKIMIGENEFKKIIDLRVSNQVIISNE